MVTLFGTNYTREELLQHVGDLTQLAGVRIGELGDGFERGVRVADFRTGADFDFSVLIDRGMDIGHASFGGAALAWRSPTTAIAPAYYEEPKLGWLRGFQGGLLTTCGLTYFGSPGTDAGVEFGLHGRASFLPATNVAYDGAWHDDEYEMWITGELREASALGENLVLRRRISARLGESRLKLEDTVTNQGYQSTPHMLLYHCNFGFPLLCGQTELLSASARVMPRDEIAAQGIADYARYHSPDVNFREQVFYHTPKPAADGWAQVALVNRAFRKGQGLGAYIRFQPEQLPCVVQWKMLRQGTYVSALEPATNWVEGRAKERAEGRLQYLEPGEMRHYQLEIGVLASQSEIDAFAAGLPR